MEQSVTVCLLNPPAASLLSITVSSQSQSGRSWVEAWRPESIYFKRAILAGTRRHVTDGGCIADHLTWYPGPPDTSSLLVIDFN